MNWQNKVVLITGASSGIGRALGVRLASQGAAVGLLARRRDLLANAVAEIEAAGGRALALPADVTHAESVKAAACELRKVNSARAGLVGLTRTGTTVALGTSSCSNSSRFGITSEFNWVTRPRRTGSPVASLSRPGGNVTGVVSGFVTGPMVTMTAGWATFPLPPRSLNPSVKGLAGQSAVG